MKNLSLSLMLLATLSLNLAPAQAVNKQIKINANNELHSQGDKIISSDTQYRYYCYLIPFDIVLILCK